MIPFNRAPYTGAEDTYILESIHSRAISGDQEFSKRCQGWFEQELCCARALLTTSCTHALELAAIVIDIKPGDEVIMPSYTFVSTANAFVLRGAKIVFVDIRSDTLNIDEQLIEGAITKRTKAIVPVHYAGVACEMDTIMDIADKHGLVVIEDAAQGMKGEYHGKPLGTIGHLGAYSFHETKNYTSAGEGGVLLVNEPSFVDKAEIVREKGTNRAQFFRGMRDKYTWVDIGSSYLLNDISAAYLWGQLVNSEEILRDRLRAWGRYRSAFEDLAREGVIEIPSTPSLIKNNGHIFYIIVSDLATRSDLLEFLREKKVLAVFHYVPLHTSDAGKRFGVFHGRDVNTTSLSERIVRLPLFFGISDEDQEYIIGCVKNFFHDA